MGADSHGRAGSISQIEPGSMSEIEPGSMCLVQLAHFRQVSIPQFCGASETYLKSVKNCLLWQELFSENCPPGYDNLKEFGKI